MASLKDDELLSVRTLSQKTTLLVSLVEASRTSELQALDLQFKVFKAEGGLLPLTRITDSLDDHMKI